MVTRVIHLTDTEATELHDYTKWTGEAEAELLKRAALRGLRELRLERALREYRESGDSYRAAAFAGLPRAAFLQALIDNGVVMLDGPSMIATDLDILAEKLGDAQLAAAARLIARESECN